MWEDTLTNFNGVEIVITLMKCHCQQPEPCVKHKKNQINYCKLHKPGVTVPNFQPIAMYGLFIYSCGCTDQVSQQLQHWDFCTSVWMHTVMLPEVPLYRWFHSKMLLFTPAMLPLMYDVCNWQFWNVQKVPEFVLQLLDGNYQKCLQPWGPKPEE